MTSTYKQGLLPRIADHGAVVVIIGLGYVGLPLAQGFAEAGLKVTGIDIESVLPHVRKGQLL